MTRHLFKLICLNIFHLTRIIKYSKDCSKVFKKKFKKLILKFNQIPIKQKEYKKNTSKCKMKNV